MKLEINGLSFRYGENRVLRQVSFCGEGGDLIAVLGCNGAGKTTLFRCLLRLLKPEQGKLSLDGKELSAFSRTELANAIAYIPQSSVPVFNYTVLDTVLMGLTGSLRLLSVPGKRETEAAMEVLSRLGIAQLAGRGICELSGGERQLVLIARAMVQRAKILLMDEPTANLDYGNQLRVLQQLGALAQQGYLILFSTHNPEHALLFARKALVLHDGEVLAFGEAAQVLTEDCMRRIYGVNVAIRELTVNGKVFRLCVPLKGAEG